MRLTSEPMTDLGTLAWGHRTGGRLTDVEKSELNGRMAAVFEAATRPAPDMPLNSSFESLAPPDSELCIEATALWNLSAVDWLAAHGYRTWYFAKALSEIDRLQVDPELLYVACVLHDLGLTSNAIPTDEIPCFAVRGATEAAALVEPHRGAEGANSIGDAISMHLNIDVSVEGGALSYLVAAGSLIDVLGPRLQLLPNDLLAAILVEHPRGPFAAKIGEVFAKCAVRYPETRCGHLENTLTFSTLVTQHPLDLPLTT